jgi:hypothetical protein
MTLDSIIQNLDLYLADEVTDPIGYLETLLLNLKELRDEQRLNTCHDPQCGDSTWDHNCPTPARVTGKGETS